MWHMDRCNFINELTIQIQELSITQHKGSHCAGCFWPEVLFNKAQACPAGQPHSGDATLTRRSDYRSDCL